MCSFSTDKLFGSRFFLFFFFNDTATTEIYTLSLHDALPIWSSTCCNCSMWGKCPASSTTDRKSTRLNSSHTVISYAVFCLKKKKRPQKHTQNQKKKKIQKQKTKTKKKQ